MIGFRPPLGRIGTVVPDRAALFVDLAFGTAVEETTLLPRELDESRSGDTSASVLSRASFLWCRLEYRKTFRLTKSTNPVVLVKHHLCTDIDAEP